MKNKIHILLAITNHPYSEELKTELTNRGFTEILTANTPEQMLDVMKNNTPHIIVCEIRCARANPVSLMELLSRYQVRPYFVFLVPVEEAKLCNDSHDYVNTVALTTPCTVHAAASAVERLSFRAVTAIDEMHSSPIPTKNKEKIEHSNEITVTDIFRRLCAPPNVYGYQYARYAIVVRLNANPNDLTVNRRIYPSVAEKFNTSPSKVERSIRHMIESLWFNGDKTEIRKYFGNNSKPSNYNFIATIADAIRIGSPTGD